TELGITIESVKALAQFFREGTAYAAPFPQRRFGESFVVSKAQLGSWVRELTDYQGVWRTLPDRTARIVDRVNEIFRNEGYEDEIEVLEDVVYQRYPVAIEALEGVREDVPATASVWCAITDDPVSLPHSEHLAVSGGQKPQSLPPDRVGWHALLENEFLTMHTLGSLSRFRTFQEECEEAGGD
ncbi:MAG: hypothetical protein ACOCV2_14920, partial [Persicimonas sp.]